MEWTCNKLGEMNNAHKISARKYEVKRSLGTTDVYVTIKIQFYNIKRYIQERKNVSFCTPESAACTV